MRIEDFRVPGPEQAMAIEREARRMRAEVIASGFRAVGRWIGGLIGWRPQLSEAPRHGGLDARA
jgi:hypothetical protein